MKRAAAIAAFSVMLIGAAPVAEATIVVNSALRDVGVGVAAGGDGTPSGDYLGASSPSSAVTGTFVDTSSQLFSDAAHTDKLAQADQNSTINAAAGLFSGTGDAGLQYSMYQSSGVYAKSIFDITFTLSAAYDYTLSGALTTDIDGGRAESLFQIFDAGSNAIVTFDSIASSVAYIPSVPMSSSGTLAAGSYRFLVESMFDNCSYSPSRTLPGGDTCTQGTGSMGSPYFNNTFDFALQLTEASTPPPTIPEPATLALLGSMFIAGAWTRRLKS